MLKLGEVGATIIGAAALLCHPAAQAQSAPPTDSAAGMENSEATEGNEIIVTATKRSERLLDVAASVSAVTGEDYSRLNARQLEDIQKLVPSLSIVQGQGVQSTRYTIRGIGSVSTRAALQSGVAVFIDDVFQASPVQSNVDLIDVERIEVLRGPQGTLFGRNTEAGAIRIVSRLPGNSLAANAEALYGNFDYFTVRGGISGPIVPGALYAGIAASHVEGGGYVSNPNTGSRAPSSNRDSARLTLRFAPEGGRGSLILTGSYAKSFDITAIPVPQPFSYRQNGSSDQTLDSQSHGIALRGELDLGGVTLNTISAYDFTKFRTGGDGDGDPRFFFTNAEQREQQTFSQEIRLTSTGDGPFQWIAGGYYYNERYSRFAGETINLGALAPPSITVPGLGTLTPTFFPSATPTIRDQLRVLTDSWALFGDLSYQFGQFELHVGGRYTWDNQDGTLTQLDSIGFRYGPLPPTLIVSQLFSQQAIRSTNFSPRVVLSYRPGKDTNLYASISRGFKGGGFNTSLDPNSVQFLTVRPETVTTYELGAKSVFADRRISLSASGFYTDLNDMQVVQQVNSALNLTATVNAAKARIYGFELEGSVRMSRAISFGFGLGYTNAQFDRYPTCVAARRNNQGVITVPAVDCDGKRLALVPDWTATGLVDLRQPLGDRLTLVANATVRYTAERFVNVDNGAASLLPAFTTVDGNIGVDYGNWSLGIWARNLLDEQSLNIYQNSPFFGNIYLPGPRRTYGVRASFRF